MLPIFVSCACASIKAIFAKAIFAPVFEKSVRCGCSCRLRILEAIREIGILLMAFAPLDGALMPMPETQRHTLLLFFFGGVLLFVLGAVAEMGIDDGR
jgi:hypothetical protein